MLPSTALDVLYGIAQRLGRHRYWPLYPAVLFAVVTLINGIGIVPEEPYQRLSENPFVTRTDIHFNNYWQENPLLPVIAHYLGLTSPTAFNILCITIIVGAFLSFAHFSRQQWGSVPSLAITTLLITSPLTTVMLTWLGTPDGLTLALSIPFLFTHSHLVVFFLGIFGIANHPAFMIAVMEILALRWVARDGIRFTHLLITATGMAVGHGLVRWFLAVNRIETISRAEFMFLTDAMGWIKMNASNLPMSLFSLFNIHWLILVLCLVMFFNKDRKYYRTVLAFLLINYGITFVTLDTTRIFSLLSWGVLFACVFHSLKLAVAERDKDPGIERQFMQYLILIGLVSLLTPRYFSWAGEIHATPFYEFLRMVFR